VRVFAASLALSIMGHCAALQQATRNPALIRTTRPPIAVTVIERPTAPLLPAREPPPDPVRPQPKSRPVPVRRPMQPPPSVTAAAPPSTRQVVPVFGLSLASTVAASSFSVRTGNTIMQAPDASTKQLDGTQAYSAAVQAVDKPPAVKRRAYPKYTREGRDQGIEGAVELLVEVRADGTVGEVLVTRGLGYGLDEAAVAALHATLFAPAQLRGQPVAVQLPYTVRFLLD
jgi:protein TonB